MTFQFDPRLNAGTAKFMRGLNLGRRIPLAQRASEAAQARTISLEQARAHHHLDRFELGGNRFQIFRSDDYDNAELAARIVSHLGSAFSGLALGLYLSKNSSNIFSVTLKAARFENDFSSDPYQVMPPTNFKLRFYCVSGRIDLKMIRSDLLGKGGAALVALYNAAKESGFRNIKFEVSDDPVLNNPPVQRFYCQLDFGKPMNRGWTQWEVDLGR